MNDFLSNVLSTIIGVMVGGFITLKINDTTNAKLLKKEHTLKMLQEIKYLLNGWNLHILEEVAGSFETRDLENFKIGFLSKDLQKLIQYFNTDMSALKDFKKDFQKLRNQEIALQLKEGEYKNELLNLVKKYDLPTIADTYRHTEGYRIWENYAEESNAIMEGIQELIVLIDEHISNNILK